MWIADVYRRWRRNRARNVFRFFDGQRMRAVDPFTVYLALDRHPTFEWGHIVDATNGDAEATEKVVGAVREVFGIPSSQENCLTAREVCQVMDDYAEWIEASKKKYVRGSTSSLDADGARSAIPAGHPSTMNSSAA